MCGWDVVLRAVLCCLETARVVRVGSPGTLERVEFGRPDLLATRDLPPARGYLGRRGSPHSGCCIGYGSNM